jgi:hypothetical protein
MPALMNTWRPKHDQESEDEYRIRVVEAGDGDIYRGMEIMHHTRRHQTEIISELLQRLQGGSKDTTDIMAITCHTCSSQEYVIRTGDEADGDADICYTCRYIRRDTKEWLNHGTNVDQEL